MKLLAWVLCVALGGGDEKDAVPRPNLLPADASTKAGKEAEAVKRRLLPLSAREAVSLSLNHNLDIEVARYQPWIEDQNIYSAMGLWDHVAYASISEARD